MKKNFLSLADGNQEKVLYYSSVTIDDIIHIKNKYSCLSFDVYDNSLISLLDILEQKYQNQPLIKDENELIDYWLGLNRKQKSIWTFFNFEGQISNGGIYQFFFNLEIFSFAVYEALEEMGLIQLSEIYKSYLIEYLQDEGKIDDLKKNYENSTSFQDKWSSFIIGYDKVFIRNDIENYLFNDENRQDIYKSIFNYIETNISFFTQKQ